jgi:glutathionyl-hydroquinone reductase
MGQLVNGRWTDGELAQETSERGQFQRVESQFRERVTAGGSSGFPAEAGRYHLYVSHGCPWARRTLIYRALKKPDGAISVALCAAWAQAAGLELRERPAVSGLHP